VRGRLLLAAALLLVASNRGGADEEPRANPERVVVFECGPHRWVFRYEELLQQDFEVLSGLEDQLRSRGFRLAEASRHLWSTLFYVSGPDPGSTFVFPADWLDGIALRRIDATPAPRPEGRRGDAARVALFVNGPTRFEAVLSGCDDQDRLRILGTLQARGWRLEQVVDWPAPEPTPAERDAAALVAGDGKLPEGYVPAGREAPGEIPPLPVLGGTVVLEIVGGEPRARVTAAPEGSRARKIGLREGDLILEVGGKGVGPLVLAALDESPPAGGQHTLRVRRTHGGIERIEIDSWVGLPSR
jgi:hypothetical protein